MTTNLFGLGSLSDLSVLATITAILVQIIKNILPQKVPTKLVTIIVGILVTELFVCTNFAISVANIGIGILMGCITAFISMNGFDTFKSIWDRMMAGDE